MSKCLIMMMRMAVLTCAIWPRAEVLAGEIRGRVLSTDGAGVSEAVVFAQDGPAGATAPATPRTAVMDQIGKQFVPHILPVTVGTEVFFPNHDQMHHHVYSFSRTKSFEIPLHKGETAPPVLFDKAGAVKVGCNIHDWMSAVILVVPTPYFALTDASGAFVLPNLPPGTYALGCWHEGSQVNAEDTVRSVEVDGRTPEVTFSIPVQPVRPRPAAHGVRGYE